MLLHRLMKQVHLGVCVCVTSVRGVVSEMDECVCAHQSVLCSLRFKTSQRLRLQQSDGVIFLCVSHCVDEECA